MPKLPRIGGGECISARRIGRPQARTRRLVERATVRAVCGDQKGRGSSMSVVSCDADQHNREIHENRKAWARKPVLRRAMPSFTVRSVRTLNPPFRASKLNSILRAFSGKSNVLATNGKCPLVVQSSVSLRVRAAKGTTSARVSWCLSVAKFRAGFPLGLRFRARLGIISFSDCPS